ncbi:MAG: oligosaccharide flippase family protein [Methylococcaceae bacterium]
MSGLKQKLLFGSFWALSGKILMIMLAMVLNMVLARLLSPEDMGAYFISLAVVVTVAAFAQVGMNQAIVRLIAEGMAKGSFSYVRKAVFFAIQITLIGSGVLGFIIYVGVGDWLARDVFDLPVMNTILGLLVLWVFGRGLQDILAECFRGFHSIGLATFFGGLFSTAVSVFFCLYVYVQYKSVDLNLAIKLIVLAFVINAVLAMVFVYKRLPEKSIDASFDKMKVVRLAFPLWGSALISMILVQLDVWVVGIAASAIDVAMYGAAIKLVMLVSMPLMIVNAVVPPIIAEYHSNDNITVLENTLRSMTSIATLSSLVIMFVFILQGDYFLGLVYGEGYKGSAQILSILCLGHAFSVWAGACGFALNMTGHQKSLLKIMIVTLILALLASYPAAKYFGVLGVATVTSGWLILLHGWALIETKRKIGVWTHAHWNPFVITEALKKVG